MKITKIVAQSDGKKFNVFIDGEYTFFIKGSKFQFQAGDFISDADLENIFDNIIFPECWDKALYLLKFKSRTKKELAEKLSQCGYVDLIVDRVIDELKNYNLLDDKAFAKDYLSLSLNKGYGLKKISFDLINIKGIDKEIVAEVFDDSSDADEFNAAYNLLQCKFSSKKCDSVLKNKIYSFLYRRGFSNDVISEVLSFFIKRK